MAEKARAQSVLPLFGQPLEPNSPTTLENPNKLHSPENLAAANENFQDHFLGLAQIRGVGLQALRAFIQHYNDLAQIWEDNPSHLARILNDAHVRSVGHIVDAIAIEGSQLRSKGTREKERLARNGYRLIGHFDPDFPKRLRDLPNRPLWLFLEGSPQALNGPPLTAVVGTREASEQGIDTTRHLTRLVLDAGFGIVSGLAEGIDRAAHQTAARIYALQVAVLGTGIDVMFPSTNTDLRRQIVESGGAVITEYLPNEKYGKANFVQRNRIQAGLASAVCPVEGRAQGGTAHTFRFAREYKRALFGAYRGHPSPENELISTLQKEGAPVFDLATEVGRKELRTFLDQFEGQRTAPPPPVDKQFWVKRALGQLIDLQTYYDLSLAEKRRIVNDVERVLGFSISEEDSAQNDGKGRSH